LLRKLALFKIGLKPLEDSFGREIRRLNVDTGNPLGKLKPQVQI
jgi:hypothetical protein